MNDSAASLLFTILITWFVAQTSGNPQGFFSKFYKWVPSIILLYLLPAVAVNVGVLRPGGSVRLLAMDTALPLCLLVLTAIVNVPELLKISRSALLVFFAGTMGIVLGGPIALALVGWVIPDLLADHGANSTWKGLVCITGSWINGTPGQLSMKEVYGASNAIFLSALAADVLLQNGWLFFLIYSARFQDKINRVFFGKTKVDIALVDDPKLATEHDETVRFPGPKAWALMAAAMAIVLYVSPLIAKGFASLTDDDPSANWSYLGKKSLWLVVLSTTLGLVLSLTGIYQQQLRFWSRIGNFLLFFVIASIGLQLDLRAVNFQVSFLAIGVVWLLFHLGLLLMAVRLLRVPWHFAAIGSQANIGGPASASVVALAFHPSLVSLAVLLGVLSNVIGNYANLVAGALFQWVAN